MFAVVDVETTGGHPSGHRMTEIAIALHNGIKVIDQYTTLLNPEQNIPLGIQTLTGISNHMVADAPLFEEKADEIRSFLADYIFVAHNVNFDLGFVQSAFARCGIDYNPRRLCSVRYARKVAKGLRSYSLKNLCSHFKVRNEAAHRAWGDTEATATILGYLLEMDKQGQWQHMIKRNKGEFNLPANLPSEEFHNLPERPGVYYFYNNEGKPIYIGKARNLKKRVASHFGTDKESKKSQAFKRDIVHINYELTGSELVASLLEDHEIRHYWPIHNRAQKKPKNRFGIFAFKDGAGQWCMAINRLQKQGGFLADFYSLHEAQTWLMNKVLEFKLNPGFCGFTAAYLPDTEGENHNLNFEKFTAQLREQNSQMIIKTPGREREEDGFVLIENSQVKGIGFVSHHSDLQDPENFTDQMRPLANSVTTSAIIRKILDERLYPQFQLAQPANLQPTGTLF